MRKESATVVGATALLTAAILGGAWYLAQRQAAVPAAPEETTWRTMEPGATGAVGDARTMPDVPAETSAGRSARIIACALPDGSKAFTNAAEPFYTALFDVMEAEGVERGSYENLIRAVENLPARPGRARVAAWPVLTQFPYIARPDCHMLLKPDVTRSCAGRMLFDLNYSAALNWKTYGQLLVLSDTLFAFLEPLGARDYIDVQSFIWVIGMYPEQQK